MAISEKYISLIKNLINSIPIQIEDYIIENNLLYFYRTKKVLLAKKIDNFIIVEFNDDYKREIVKLLTTLKKLKHDDVILIKDIYTHHKEEYSRQYEDLYNFFEMFINENYYNLFKKNNLNFDEYMITYLNKEKCFPIFDDVYHEIIERYMKKTTYYPHNSYFNAPFYNWVIKSEIIRNDLISYKRKIKIELLIN